MPAPSRYLVWSAIAVWTIAAALALVVVRFAAQGVKRAAARERLDEPAIRITEIEAQPTPAVPPLPRPAPMAKGTEPQLPRSPAAAHHWPKPGEPCPAGFGTPGSPCTVLPSTGPPRYLDESPARDEALKLCPPGSTGVSNSKGTVAEFEAAHGIGSTSKPGLSIYQNEVFICTSVKLPEFAP